VAALRRRLAAEGYLEAAPLPAPDGAADGARAVRFDAALAGAVGRFQARHGLTADGVVGPRTRAALDVSAADRARQIEVNLERLRWLPPDLGDRFVLVNVPAFRPRRVRRGARALTMRVVVGSELEDRRTPIFSDSMQYVQFGPYWNVPRGIAVREILPHARGDRGYLERHGYEMVRGWGDGAPVVSAWALSDAELFSPRYRVRQRPGPRNALGRVKFMFPNDFAVYLHDTPARSLFADSWRAGSHGCVRVADPAALAAFALRGLPAWDAARIGETLAAGRRVRVDLPRKLPVYLVYLTAFVRDGEVAFRSDLYDLDARLTRALAEPSTATAGAAADELASRAGDGGA
jgi:murein L,D-transpeptidase YcbB/YkuD